MNLKSKRAIIVTIFAVVVSFAIVAAFGLFLLIFRLGFYIRHNAAPTSHNSPEAQASPMIGQSPSPSPNAPLPPPGRNAPENRDFAIWTVTDPKRYWAGENINPYPLLR